jgi:hypothetical protein
MQDYLPILQFGQFSSIFEYINDHITFADIVGLTAFIQLPQSLGSYPIFQFQINKNYLLIEKRQFRENVQLFQKILLNNSVNYKIRKEFSKNLRWFGWKEILTNNHKFRNYEPIVRFCYLYQMVWLGSIMKELIVKNYRTSLRRSFPSMEPDEFESLFLDTIINPGSSYILNKRLKNLNDTICDKSDDNFYNHTELRVSRLNSLIKYRKAISIIKQQSDYNELNTYLQVIKTLAWLFEEKNNKINEIKLKINRFCMMNDSFKMLPLLSNERKQGITISNSLSYMLNYFSKYRNLLTLNV